MKRFSKLMSLLLFAAVTQYSCINDADVVIADDTHSRVKWQSRLVLRDSKRCYQSKCRIVRRYHRRF